MRSARDLAPDATPKIVVSTGRFTTMTAIPDRDAVAQASETKIVPAGEDEAADFWLVSGDGETFPIQLERLHDIMHALHDLHDQVHHH